MSKPTFLVGGEDRSQRVAVYDANSFRISSKSLRQHCKSLPNLPTEGYVKVAPKMYAHREALHIRQITYLGDRMADITTYIFRGVEYTIPKCSIFLDLFNDNSGLYLRDLYGFRFYPYSSIMSLYVHDHVFTVVLRTGKLFRYSSAYSLRDFVDRSKGALFLDGRSIAQPIDYVFSTYFKYVLVGRKPPLQREAIISLWGEYFVDVISAKRAGVVIAFDYTALHYKKVVSLLIPVTPLAPIPIFLDDIQHVSSSGEGYYAIKCHDKYYMTFKTREITTKLAAFL